MATQKEVSMNLMDQPSYRECWDKYQTLTQQLSDLEKHINDLLAWDLSKEKKSLKERKVQAILDNEDPDEVRQADWHENYNAAVERRSLLRAAIEAQKRELDKQRLLASKGICEAVKPQYDEIIKQLAKAWIVLGEWVCKEISLRRELNDEQIAYQSYGITPQPINRVGDPHTYTSHFSAWLIEAVRLGYITKSDIPKEWREKWYRLSGFKFEGDNLNSTPFPGGEYDPRKEKGTVNVVLQKTRKSIEKEGFNIGTEE